MRGAEVSALMTCEESHPCILRNNSAGGLKLQCGRIAAVKARGNGAADRSGAGHMHTPIFHDDSDDCISAAESLPD